jgi:hypothetical protein
MLKFHHAYKIHHDTKYSARKKKYVNQKKCKSRRALERMKIGCGGREYTSQGDPNERQKIALLALFF